MTAVDPAIERFRADFTDTLGRSITPDDRIAVAVSGGPDSMVLLALAAAAWPGQVIAATVDHGLRADAADEAAMVAAWCAASRASPAKTGAQQAPTSSQRKLGSQAAGAGQEPLETPAFAGVTASGADPWSSRFAEDVPHATLKPTTPLGPTNLQANARTARYALLTNWVHQHHATILATAHHADDQAETFLMRAARGSGVAGLASIRPSRQLDHDITLLRPLLGWRRAELRALAERWRLPFVDDPSNTSDRHDRTRFRALFNATPWLDPAQIARSAGYLREADADLRAIETWLLDTRSVPAEPGHYAIDASGLPRDLRRRLARAGIARVRPTDESPWNPAVNIESLLDALDGGKPANQAGVMVSVKHEIWYFRPEPPRRET